MNEKLIIEVEAKARQAITEFDKLDNKFKELSAGNKRLQNELWRQYNAGTQSAAKNTSTLSGNLGMLKGGLAALGTGIAAREVLQFGAASLKAAGDMNNLVRGMTFIEGSTAGATQRVKELFELAKNPSLDFETLIKYDAIMKNNGATAEDNNLVFRALSRSVSTFGGTMHDVAGTLHQYQQAQSKGTIQSQDFRIIVERTQGTLLVAARNVHDFTGGVEQMGENFKASGLSFDEYMRPVWQELEKLPGAEVEGYTNMLGNLEDQFKLLQAAVGQKLMPTFKEWAGALLDLMEKTTEFIEGEKTKAEVVTEISGALKGNTESYEGLSASVRNYIRVLQDETEKIGDNTDKTKELGDQIWRLTAGLNGNADALREAAEEVTNQQDRIIGLKEEESRLEEALSKTSKTAAASRGVYRDLSEQLQNNRQAQENARGAVAALNGVLEVNKRRTDELRKSFSELTFKKSSDDIRVLAPEVDTVNTKFLTFSERSDALKGSIAALPPEITAVRTGFDGLAPMTARVNAIFTEYNETLGQNIAVSGIVVSSAEEEAKALAAVTKQIIQQTQDAEALAHIQEVLTQRTDAHNAALVNPAVSDAVESMRDFSNIIGDVNLGYDEIIPLTQDFVDGLVAQESAFDDLREATGAADLSLDDFDETMQAIDQAAIDATDNVSSLDLAFEELGNNIPGFLTDTLDLLALMNSELEGVADSVNNLVRSAASGDAIGFLSQIPGLAESLNQLQTDPNLTTEARAQRGFDVIGAISESDLTISQQSDLIQPIQEYIRELLVRSILSSPEAISPGLIAQHESFALAQGFDFNFARDREASGLTDTPFQTAFDLPERDFSGIFTRIEGILTRAETRAGIATSGRQRRAPSILEPAPGYTGSVIDAVTATEQPTTTGEQITEQPTTTGETPVTAETPAALGTVHRFTGAENQKISVLSGVIKQKRKDFKDLTDADFSTILDMYGEYTQAILNLYNEKVGVIGGADNIDGAAKSTAMGLALQEYNLLTYRANRDLEDVMADSNLTLVTEFGSTTGALGRNQILSTTAETPTTETPTTETPTAETAPSATPAAPLKPLGDDHRFTGAQSGEIGNIKGEAQQLRKDFSNLTDADFSTILDAYFAYTGKLQDLYDKRIEFINAAPGITEKAKGTARKAALIAFQEDTFDANEILERVMGNSDLRLVNEFGATTGIIPRGQVIKGVVHGDARTGVVKATQPTYITGSSPSVAPAKPLGTSHRFTSTQSNEIGNIKGEAKQARTDFSNLTNADFSTILTKYGEYTGKLQDLYDKRIEFINAAPGITEKAKGTARKAALIAFQEDTFDANEILERVMGNSDLRLVNEFGATTGIIPRGQVIKGVVHGDARTGVVKATQPTYITGSSTPAVPVKPLGESHRFTGAQSGEIRNMEKRADQLRTDFGNLTDADFSTIIEKYVEYTGKLQDLYDKRIEFINAAPGITEAAKGIAREAALIAFQNDTFEANGILSSVMAASGEGLATEFGATTGILPSNQIIRNVPAPVMQQQTAATPVGGTTPGGPTPLERQPQNNALLWNDVQQARWELDTSGSESEFEEDRGTLREATVAYYDAEIERIKELGLVLDEEKDKLEDNSLAREKALYRIDEMENRYATDRIKREAAEAAEKAKALETETAEKAKALETETAEKAKALETEAAEKAALQEKIEAIYLDAFDVEVNRLDRLKALNREYYEDLADLAETAQEKIFNSTLRGDRKLEDMRHRLARRMFEDTVSFDDLTDAQKSEVTGSLEYQRAEFDLGLGASRSRFDLRREFGELREGTPGHQYYLEEIKKGELTDPRLIEELFGRRGAGLAEGYNEDMLEINMDAKVASTELAISLQELKTPVDLLKESIVELNSAVGSGGAVGSGTRTQPIIYVMIDSEQIITPNFVEKVNDQGSVNIQNGVGIR